MDKDGAGKKKIKAIILAAGLGTRLRPITNKIPKCLVEVGNKTVLEMWLDKLEEANCDEVLINTHYMKEKVTRYVARIQDRYKQKIELVHEKNLLGTAGTIFKNIEFLEGSTGIILHADNWSTLNINDLLERHNVKPEKCIMSMTTFTTDDKINSGIVVKDREGVITEYYEKSLRLWEGSQCRLFIVSEKFIEEFKQTYNGEEDFCKEIIPKMIGKIQAIYTDKQFIDIGTINKLNAARSIASREGL